MGAKVSVEQQSDLGILAKAALRYALGKSGDRTHVTIAGAVAHFVPYLAETDIRQLMWEVDSALSAPDSDKHTWAELMTVLRRVDRP